MSTWLHELTIDSDKDFILDGIHNGFKVMNIPDNLPSAECNNYKSATCATNRPLVEKQLKSELRAGHYKICRQKPQIISAIGAIPKPDSSDIRIIHDCSRPINTGINAYANPEKFSFETIDSALSLAPYHAWMAKIDIKSAYRHVALHPSQYPATGIKFKFTGDDKYTYMYDTRLMFGASESVGVFHRITQSIVRMMRRKGFHSTICYLDDFLIMEKTYDRCKLAMDTLQQLLIRLGFTLNYNKCVQPTQRLTFLGIDIDMVQQMLFIPPAKLNSIRDSTLQALSWNKATKRQLQSLVGLISWGAKCVKAIRPILRSLIDLQSPLKHPSHRIRLPAFVKMDLAYFHNWCVKFNGVSFAQRFQPNTVVWTDSSPEAGAAYSSDKDFLYHSWSADFPGIMSQPIYIKELAAVLLAFHRWAPLWHNKSVHIHTDNQATKWAIRKGLSKNVVANALLKELLWIAAMFNISVNVSYITSKNNVIADALSRMHDSRFLTNLISLLWDQDINIASPYYNLLFHMSHASYVFLQSKWLCHPPLQLSGVKRPNWTNP